MKMPLESLLAEPLRIKGLTAAENLELTRRRRDALAATGRLELDDAAVCLLVRAFLVELGEFAPDAVDAFYELRDELPASIPDAELIDALVAAAKRSGGAVDNIDVPELASELRQKDDAMSHYSITDDTGRIYRWDPRCWVDDELASGWDGELWEADYDD